MVPYSLLLGHLSLGGVAPCTPKNETGKKHHIELSANSILFGVVHFDTFVVLLLTPASKLPASLLVFCCIHTHTF